jgi:hypothetical protein
MRRLLLTLLVVVLLLGLPTGCTSSTQTGVRTSSHQTLSGGDVSVRIKSAQGAGTADIEVEDGSGLTLDAEVTLSVGSGSYKIELLGEDDAVTLALEAQAGQTVSGTGWMVVDSFDEASYRVTAVDARDIEYTIVYAFR